jgi:DNA-binding response OmpR family regulator
MKFSGAENSLLIPIQSMDCRNRGNPGFVTNSRAAVSSVTRLQHARHWNLTIGILTIIKHVRQFRRRVMNPRILIGDDEEDVLALLNTNLSRAGFAVSQALSGAEVIARVREQRPALIVLDVMLPELTGFEVCKLLKGDARTSSIPIILLTAKAQEIDRVLGLELGADDYVTKPFSPRELVLRIQSLLRKKNVEPVAEDLIRVGEISLNRSRHTVRVKNRPLELTATEFKLLALLMERCGRVQSRDSLLRDVWDYDAVIESRTVDIHVKRLREKLGKAALNLETVRGFGYRLSELRA